MPPSAVATSSASDVVRPALPSSAATQFLGYSLQEIRLVDHLLQAGPGVAVSLEVLGDTAVESPDGTVVSEEAKSRVGNSNPISDRSPELWKTIANWLAAIQVGRLDPVQTRFRLYVSRPFPGQLAQAFSDASDRASAVAAIESARTILGLFDGGPTLPSALRTHVEMVFAAPELLLAQLVENFELQSGGGRAIEDLSATMDRQIIPPELAPEVLAYALGWVKTSVTPLIEQGLPAVIHWDDFRARLVNIVRHLDQRNVLRSFAGDPARDEVDAHLSVRTYVRQLELIDIEFDDLVRAVTDFIKSEADVVAWAERCEILDGDLEPFEAALMNTWRNTRRRTEIAHRHLSESERGQVLYAACCDHRVSLDSREVPEYFCRGSLHRLSDDQTLGWHPDYLSRLASAPQDKLG